VNRRRYVAQAAAICAALMLAIAKLAAAAAPAATAPDFRRDDLAGRPVRLSDYRGKVVLLDFWATWCAPCLEEMPTFVRWQKQYGPARLQVIGVSMDDEAQPVQRFIKKTPVGYPIIMGDTELEKLYGGVLGLPLTYLIDVHGHIAARYLGDTDLSAMEARIRELLARPGHSGR
jgi:cytochrome c biogenesis protein CcmG/thiol:disulfide interchange protein DsbE